MKQRTKKIVLISMAAFFGIIMVGSSTFSLFNGFGGSKVSQSNIPPVTLTGTPEDNYSPDKRTTFCQSDNNTRSTKYITEFKVPTLCTQPLAITTDPSGSVWFTEANTGNIAKFDPISKSFQEFSNAEWQKGEKSMMWGIYRSPDGNIWFSDSQHNLIWKFDTQNKNYMNFIFPQTPGQQSFPQMLVPDGNYILANDFTGRKVAIFGTNQTGPALQATSIMSPADYNFTSDMIPDKSGKIWYTIWIYQQGGELVSFDPTTSKFAEYTLPSGIQAPNGISVDPSGKLWLTDTASSIFFSFDPQSQQFTKYITLPPPVSTYGNASGLIKTPITRPYWNQFDDQGRLWFNEQVANSMAVFDPSKESLVEYLVPSKNPNWSDCGIGQDCGVAQVLDFTVAHDKVWFTEWVENNIGVLDPSVGLPIDMSTSATSISVHRGQNETMTVTLSPNQSINGTVSILTAETSSAQDLNVTSSDQNIVLDKPKTVTVTLSADNFALPGTYKVVVGARNQDVTISKFVTVTIQ
ncbi:MAG: virginiamycin B lyase family protein [Nitrosotalea sp.]